MSVVSRPCHGPATTPPRSSGTPDRAAAMTLAITEAGGGQWMFTIVSADGTTLGCSTPYINKSDARRAAEQIVEGFGTGTVLG
jgi:hypothetical protein